ncbi:histamine N-methyltransferase-like [Diadema antillarum]|uniref:histamine N-methyltransferase-like n=1 Tax=Diadema antillarum TaxID=105358 RepID=UPI003A8666C5
MAETELLPSAIKLPSILDDLDSYHDAYDGGMLPVCDGDDIEYWVTDHFQREVVDRLTQSFSGEHEMHVLGIGTGNGCKELPMIDALGKCFKRVRVNVVEPAGIIREFQQLAASLRENRADGNSLAFTWHQITLESYMKKSLLASQRHRFAFITALQSLYYVQDIDSTMDFLLDSLEEGGILLIEINPASNQTEEFLIDKPWTQFPVIVTESILKYLEGSSHVVKRFSLSSSTLDVTSVFDVHSADGSKLLDILTEVSGFRNSASPDLLQSTLASLKSLATRDEMGRYILHDPVDVLVVIKRPALSGAP